MAITENNVLSMISRFDKGRGETIEGIAESMKQTPAVIRYHLNKRNQIPTTGAAAPGDSDEDLGIGEEDAAPDALAALMKDPKFAKLIDAAVQARMAQITPNSSAPSMQTDEFKQFIAQMGRMIEVQAIQQPGYIKPLSAEEMNSRIEGRAEMLALLGKFRTENRPPRYLLGSQFFESANAILYDEGQEIRTFLEPAETFQPLNDEAAQVYGAMLQWLGGHTAEIGDQVAAAMAAAKGKDAPLVTGTLTDSRHDLPVEVMAGAARNMRPNRVTGTITPELRGQSMPHMPSSTAQPQGPIFVG